MGSADASSTKSRCSAMNNQTTIKAYDQSLRQLGVDYLYLIHWYNANVKDTWRAIEKLYKLLTVDKELVIIQTEGQNFKTYCF